MKSAVTEARKARPGDLPALEALNQRAYRRLPRLWWWGEYLTDDLFMVVERGRTLVGALFAYPDESPVAWVRLAVLDDHCDVEEWLDLALPPILDGLRRRGTQALAWMDHGEWAGPYLKGRGYRRLAEVVTLVKFDHAVPEPGAGGADVRLRPASERDVAAVVAIDRAAFTPHWWHSAATLGRRAAASSHFAVAELAGAVAGYAEGEAHPPAAHLNRVAVHPAHQGRGLGTLLLCDALRAFWRQGAHQVTLNTQTDNHKSRQLYRRCGFEPTGDTVTAWELRFA